MAAIGLALGSTATNAASSNGLTAAVGRLFLVTIFVYAALRHHALRIDLRLRWTISKTTVATLFMAMFFVVSEGAATVFSNQWGTKIGILAAGALVFGIAPIMRWADGLAEKAVPHSAEAEFRGALHMALADGEVTADEQRKLSILAEDLGIPLRHAMQMQDDASV